MNIECITDDDYPNPPQDEQRSDYHRETMAEGIARWEEEGMDPHGDGCGEPARPDASDMVYTSVDAFMNDSGDNCLPEDGELFVKSCKSALIHCDPRSDSGAHCLAMVAMDLGFQIIETMKKNGLTYNSIKVK